MSNYSTVLFDSFGDSANSPPLLGNVFNSIVITVPAVVFPLVLALMASYAFAWIPFRGSDFLFVTIFALQVVPLQLALIPLLKALGPNGLGLAGEFPGIWIAHTIFGLPLAVFLLYNFISQIPREVIEAARVDGASHTQLFFRIIIPLSLPAVASLGIFQFLWVWNDLLIASVFGAIKTYPLDLSAREPRGRLRPDRVPRASGGIRVDDRPVHRVLLAPAVLRPRPSGRFDKGLMATPAPERTGAGSPPLRLSL